MRALPRTPAFLTLVLAFAFSLAPRANAVVVVDYSFDPTTTTLNFTSPIAVTLPSSDGTLTGGADVTYTTDAHGNIADGPATLDALNLQSDLSISTTFLGTPITLNGPVEADLVSPVTGTLSGTQLSFNGADGTFHGSGSITCGGSLCVSIKLTPGVAKSFDGSASVPLPVLTVGSLHGSIAGITFVFGSLDVVATLNFDATETGRTLPEPALLTLGAASLGLLALVRRRRA